MPRIIQSINLLIKVIIITNRFFKIGSKSWRRSNKFYYHYANFVSDSNIQHSCVMIISVGKIRVTIYNGDKLMWYKRVSHFGIFVTLHVTFYIFLSGKIRESFIALLIYTCAVYLRAINVSFRIIFFTRLLTTCIESSHED